MDVESLVREYRERMGGYVRFRVPAPDSEDVLAEVFLTAVEKGAGLRSRDPTAWLFSIARSRVAEYHRRAARERAAASRGGKGRAMGSGPRPTPLEELERGEFLALLREKLETLSGIERDVIALKFTDGLGNVEIARLVRVSPNHLGVVLHRALRKLRAEMLGEVGHGVP